MSVVRLGVNIDHVATLRQARGECYPQVDRAARVALENGADQITIHLRKDRRHIQDADLEVVKKICLEHKKLFNFEMGADPEIIEMAVNLAPDWICLVPENRQEITTEGGLDVIRPDNFARIDKAMKLFREKIPETKISLFVEADLEILKKCQELGADACEIHTGEYAKAFLAKESIDKYLQDFLEAKKFLVSHEIGCHAGHGLTDESVAPLAKRDLFVEYNIGHWIIAEGIFSGLDKVISQLKMTCQNKE